MPTHVSWGSIELLHNVVLTLDFLNDRDGAAQPKIVYRAKVKQHGTNCAVQTQSDGIFAQSRAKFLTLPSGDRRGFARWTEDNRSYFETLPHGTVTFGEWCGRGVEKGMAVSDPRMEGKIFAVFALRQTDGTLLYDPEEIKKVLLGAGQELPKAMHILPWYKGPVVVDYQDKAALDQVVETLNLWVNEVEAEDPWVKDIFGISGVGEGLVFYPVGEHTTGDPEMLSLWMFKAKGGKHRTVGQRQPVQVSPEVVASVGEFVDLVVTEARLQQGVSDACGGEMNRRYTGDFIKWVLTDVQKESVAELEASGLTWEQVLKGVQQRAREWFLAPVTR